jgi:two-component system OmpR family response regulator
LLGKYLARFGLECHVAGDGAQMGSVLAMHDIDLLVLDLMLPGADGLTLARQVQQRSPIPLIMLTARSNPYDRVLGLKSGADDYLSQPFEPRELVARIQAVLRRASGTQSNAAAVTGHDVIRFDGWKHHASARAAAWAWCFLLPMTLPAAIRGSCFCAKGSLLALWPA